MSTAGGLSYVALPSKAKEPTTFAAIKVSANVVVFENAKQDFPQRVIYRQATSDSLFARIEGKRRAKEMSIDIPIKKRDVSSTFAQVRASSCEKKGCDAAIHRANMPQEKS